MKEQNKKNIVLVIVIIVLVRCIISFVQFNYKYENKSVYKTYMVKILSIEKEMDEKKSYLVALKNGNRYKDKFILNVYDNPNLILSKGDILNIVGKISIPKMLGNPGEFNYKRYLNSKGIYGTITVKSFEIQYNNSNASVINSLKSTINSRIDKAFSYEYSAFLKSMLYGNTKDLDERIVKNFAVLGISHITSVSGSNLAIFISIIGLIFQKTDKYKLLKFLVELFGVIFFNILCSGEYSIIRASICFLISKLFILFKKKIPPVKTLIISLYILIIINPYSIFNLGLQLSYLATLGIILFSQKISCNIKNIFKIYKKRKKLYKLICIISDCISITLSSQILILPIQIINFNTISLMLIPANIIVFFLTTPILFFGLLGVIFAFIPIISILLFKITYPFIFLFIFLVENLVIVTPEILIASPPAIIIFFYYCLIIVILLIDKYVLEIIKFRKKYVKKSNILKIVLIIIFASLVIFSYIYIIYLEEYFYFFNIGQGSTCFLRYNGVNVLLDAGSLQDGLSFSTLDRCFKSKGITSIDIIILSHFHKDHVDAVQELIEKYNVKRIVYSMPKEKNILFYEILKVANEQNIQTTVVYAGDTFTLNNIKFKIFSPYQDDIIYDNNIENANSMVLQIEIESKKYLFMGDATVNTEAYILNKNIMEKVYLLFVGHHGSKTSTSENFIQKISPEIAIISSKKSVYGHPNESVLQILKKYNVNTLLTEKLGAIKIKL